jgi:tRNA(fMet)-specific endonuclease VapC
MTSGADVRLVLDTSTYSHFRAGREDVLDHLARADAVLIPTIVVGELEAAFEAGLRSKENRVRLAEFLDEPFVKLLPVTLAVARHYGRMVGELRRAGTPIPTNDVWIAATTADCGGTLLTFDRHFDRIPGLTRLVLDAA